MRRYQIVTLFFLYLYSGSLTAQWIYSQGIAAMTSAPELQRINLDDHSFVRLVGMGDMGDIAFHPDQRLLGVIFDKVYLIDTITSAYSELYDIGDFQSVGMTIDHTGKMYFSGINPTTNRYAVTVYNPTSTSTRIIADFGPINQGFINDIEFYNGQLYVVGELPSSFPEQAALFLVDTSGLNQHDTIVQYNMWPGRALAAVNDTCGSQYLVSPTTNLLNYFYPPFDSLDSYAMVVSGGLFYSSGATSRTSHLGSLPPLGISNVDLSQDPCSGNSNADVTIHMQSGRPSTLQYSLDGLQFQNSNTFASIPPGQYTVFVRDAWGCQVSGSLEILDIPAFPVSIIVQPATCGEHNGSVLIHSAENGLFYALDNDFFDHDSLFTGLAGGVHTLLIRNDSGCADTMELTIDSHPAPFFEISLQAEQCLAKNGVIELTGISGVAPFQFSMDGMTWHSSPVFDQLSAGAYTIFMRDAFDCTIQENAILEETGNPEVETILINAEECNKADGSIEVTVVSAHGPILYSLNGNAYNTIPQFQNLVAGLYMLSIIDTFGCITPLSVEVPEKGGPVIEDVIVTPEYCAKANGSIFISVFSDHEPLQYAIQNGPFTNNPEFEDLPHGLYTIIIQDTNACRIQTEIFIEEIPGVRIDSVIIADTKCGLDNGTMLIFPDTNPVDGYSIDGSTYQEDPLFANLPSGFYEIYLLSHRSCIDSIDVSIANHPGPIINELSVIQPDCEGEPATISITMHGEGEMVFELDNAITNNNGIFSGLSAGNHSIIVADQLGCKVDSIFSIERVKCLYYIPNVFSPNGDGVNDVFGFMAEEDHIRLYNFEIYDRWGSRVYACKENITCTWDGGISDQPAPEGVYLYQISIMEWNELKQLAGQITLLR